jgi:SAM-dependent methyltransferase
MTINQEASTRTQQETWNDLVGAAWVRHADVHDQQAAAFGEAAMDAIGSIAGDRVLDVGCGTGATVTELLSRGAEAILGIDLSAPMIRAAQAQNRHPEARFEVGDVLELRTDQCFDVVFSRFGVMFFTDPVSAFEHLRTLAAPAARLGFCCWGPPAANPWMTLPVMATIPVLGAPQLAGPGEPGPFSMSSPDVVRDILSRAGWEGTTVRELAIDQPHPAGGADAVADIVIEFSPPIVEGLLRAPDRALDARAAIAEALRPLERDGVVHLQASALIVTANA